jgi:hypothetical protein
MTACALNWYSGYHLEIIGANDPEVAAHRYLDKGLMLCERGSCRIAYLDIYVLPDSEYRAC